MQPIKISRRRTVTPPRLSLIDHMGLGDGLSDVASRAIDRELAFVYWSAVKHVAAVLRDEPGSKFAIADKLDARAEKTRREIANEWNRVRDMAK